VHGRPRLTVPTAGLRLPAVALAAGLAVGLAPALAACSRGPQPAPRAGDPACVRALAAAPGSVLGRPRAPLEVPGALAWGDPKIVLRCGLPALGPTTAACLEVNGVDWVIADPSADPVVFTLFGRDPALELSVPASYGRSAASEAVVDVAAAARVLPANGRTCQ
jgi:Protein of unknown function (DUF3515)